MGVDVTGGSWFPPQHWQLIDDGVVSAMQPLLYKTLL